MATYPAKTKEGKCVFCDIAASNTHESCFYEDDEFVSFLSIDPNTDGFSCVIPREHYGSDILKMPDEVLQRFIVAAKSVAHILENYYEDVGRVGLVMEGTGIDHAHIKLIPMHGTEHMKRGEWRQYHSHEEQWFDTYEGWLSSAGGPLKSREELLVLSSKIRASYENQNN